MLAYERARFRADCAARAIRTAADAEKHMVRIEVARAEVRHHTHAAQGCCEERRVVVHTCVKFGLDPTRVDVFGELSFEFMR